MLVTLINVVVTDLHNHMRVRVLTCSIIFLCTSFNTAQFGRGGGVKPTYNGFVIGHS